MPLIVQFSFTVTLLSVPAFAFTLPLISAFLAVSFPSGVRENAGGFPPLVMVGPSGVSEHVVHEYLIALTNKHRFCVAIRRINHRNPVCRQQHLTLHSCWRILNTGTDTRNIKASVLHLLQLHSPHAVQIIICINLNFLYLLDCRTLIFQFLLTVCVISLLTFVMDVLISAVSGAS